MTMQSSENNLPDILIADDDPSCLEPIFHILTGNLYQVRKAYSGKQAIELLSQSPADILITDIYMEDMTGLDLMENALRINPDILTIAMTGQGDIELATEFMKRGGIDFLQKPVDKYHIIRSVESAVKRHQIIRENNDLKAISKELGRKVYEEIHRKLNIQESLRESEQRYQDIFENAPMGIFQSDSEGKFIKVNPAMAKIFGYSSPAELMSDQTDIPHKLYIIPNNGDRSTRRLPGNGSWVTFEEKMYKKDKTPIFIRNTVRIVRNENDFPLYFEGFILDISKEWRQQELFRLEMDRAKELYDLSLIPEIPTLRGLEIRIKYLPTELIGGDVVELRQIDERNILIFIADVTGHGIPAAMTANTLKSHFNEISETDCNPVSICTILNKTMHYVILKDDIIAAFCARLDLENMSMNYCLCGIPSPLILRKGQSIRLKPTGPPLGVFDDLLVIDSLTVSLENDDILLAFTDGITDVRSEKKEVFGIKGVINSVETDTTCLISDILNNAFLFQRTTKFGDDVILLSIRITDNVSEYLWNEFCTPDKAVMKFRTRYMNIDEMNDFFVNHIAEKFDISKDRLFKLRISFFEMLMNAIEHGNLEMTNFKKNPEIYDSDLYNTIFKNRLTSDAYGDRLISIKLLRRADHLEISIRDDGNGFCINDIDNPMSASDLERLQGRGIHLARMYSDQIKYNAKGNEVTLYFYLKDS